MTRYRWVGRMSSDALTTQVLEAGSSKERAFAELVLYLADEMKACLFFDGQKIEPSRRREIMLPWLRLMRQQTEVLEAAVADDGGLILPMEEMTDPYGVVWKLEEC